MGIADAMTSPLEYGPPDGEREFDAYGAIILDAFMFPQEPPTPTHAWRELVDGGGAVRVVRAGGQILGGLVRFEMGQWFGGKLVPSNAIAAVAAAPQHRGRGAAAFLMQSLIAELHRDGVALSAFYPATHTLYRRAGYEFAGVNLDYRIAVREMVTPRSALRARPMTAEDEPALARMHHARVADARGPFERGRHLWNGAIRPEKRLFAYVFEHEGQPEGYIVMTRRRAGTTSISSSPITSPSRGARPHPSSGSWPSTARSRKTSCSPEAPWSPCWA